MKTNVITSREISMTMEGKHINGNSKPVFCETDGKHWPSLSDAAEEIGVRCDNLSRSISNKRPYKGKKYRFMSEADESIPNLLARIQELSEIEEKFKEQERIRKAEEKRQSDIHKAKTKADECDMTVERIREQLSRAEEKAKNAHQHLAELTSENMYVVA